MPEPAAVDYPINIRVRTTYEGDQRAPALATGYYDSTRNPYHNSWIGPLVGIAVVIALIAAAIWLVAPSGGHAFSACASGDTTCWNANAKIGVADANARVGMASDSTDVNGIKPITTCGAACQARKVAVGVAEANARAGFGSNASTNGQYAGVVSQPPAVVLPAPALPPAIITHRPCCVVAPAPAPRVPCSTCSRNRFAAVVACLGRLGVAPGEVSSRFVHGSDHAILSHEAAARLEAHGQLQAARDCVATRS